jgi:GntR family transcriptional repressor for pyruvate dehydrogenase complex
MTQRSASHRRVKVNEEIARELQSRIQRGELKPGDQLPPERRLADMFGASRGSVREALRALELAGVILSRHGGGNFVSDLMPGVTTLPLAQFLLRQRERLLDVSEARQMFEPRLAALAAERAQAEDLDSMWRAIEDQERSLRDRDVEGAFQSDRRFHQAVAEASRNETFIMLHNYLSDMVTGSRREAIENDGRRVQSPIDHRAIFDAVSHRDPAGAAAAMLQHLKNVESVLVDALRGFQRAITTLPGGTPPEEPPEVAAPSGAGAANSA